MRTSRSRRPGPSRSSTRTSTWDGGGQISGFSVTKLAGGALRFGWNSGTVNLLSHGARAVPAGMRPAIEAAVRLALAL